MTSQHGHSPDLSVPVSARPAALAPIYGYADSPRPASRGDGYPSRDSKTATPPIGPASWPYSNS